MDDPTGSLPRGRLPEVGADDVAHEHFIDICGLNAGFFQGAPDGGSAEVGGGDARQDAAKTSDRRANRRNDKHFFHDKFPRK